MAFYDLPLAATRRPTRRELLFLIDLLDRCPYPLLIHCKSGADRTGLASALYLMVKRNQPPELAENALALEFGHVPFLGTEHLHEPLHEYAAWLKADRLDPFTRAVPSLGQDRVPLGGPSGRTRPSGRPARAATFAKSRVQSSGELVRFSKASTAIAPAGTGPARPSSEP